MPANVVKTARDEHLWNKAKEQAKKQGRTKDYAYIMGIYQRMSGEKSMVALLAGGEEALRKAGTGEGSRGGKVIGHTASGDPIYAANRQEMKAHHAAVKKEPNKPAPLSHEDVSADRHLDSAHDYGIEADKWSKHAAGRRGLTRHHFWAQVNAEQAAEGFKAAANKPGVSQDLKDKSQVRADHYSKLATHHERQVKEDKAARDREQKADPESDYLRLTKSVIREDSLSKGLRMSPKLSARVRLGQAPQDQPKKETPSQAAGGGTGRLAPKMDPLGKAGTGEGSRGGKVIGHRPNGDPIYQTPVGKDDKELHEKLADFHKQQRDWHAVEENLGHGSSKAHNDAWLTHRDAEAAHKRAAGYPSEEYSNKANELSAKAGEWGAKAHKAQKATGHAAVGRVVGRLANGKPLHEGSKEYKQFEKRRKEHLAKLKDHSEKADELERIHGNKDEIAAHREAAMRHGQASLAYEQGSGQYAASKRKEAGWLTDIANKPAEKRAEEHDRQADYHRESAGRAKSQMEKLAHTIAETEHHKAAELHRGGAIGVAAKKTKEAYGHSEIARGYTKAAKDETSKSQPQGKIIGRTADGKEVYAHGTDDMKNPSDPLEKDKQPKASTQSKEGTRSHHAEQALKYLHAAQAHAKAAHSAPKEEGEEDEHSKNVKAAKEASEGLAKAGTGEGSRGGKVIGHTSTGKPIYESFKHNKSHSHLTAAEHKEAAEHHTAKVKEIAAKGKKEFEKRYGKDPSGKQIGWILSPKEEAAKKNHHESAMGHAAASTRSPQHERHITTQNKHFDKMAEHLKARDKARTDEHWDPKAYQAHAAAAKAHGDAAELHGKAARGNYAGRPADVDSRLADQASYSAWEASKGTEGAQKSMLTHNNLAINLSDEDQIIKSLEDGSLCVGGQSDSIREDGRSRLAGQRGERLAKATIYPGEWDSDEGTRGGDYRETVARAQALMETVELDSAGNRGNGGLDEWFKDAYTGDPQSSVGLGIQKIGEQQAQGELKIIDDDDPYRKALAKAHPAESQGGIRLAYQGEGREHKR